MTSPAPNLVPVTTASGSIAWISPEEAESFRQASGNAANENARRWEAGIKLQKDQLDQTYKIAKMNARTADQNRELDREYKEKSYQLAVQAQQLARENHELNISKFGLDQGKFGLDIASRAGELAAVTTNPFALADFQRGLPGVPGASAALQSLQSGSALRPVGGPAGGQPQTYTLGGLTQQLMNAAQGGGSGLYGGGGAPAAGGGGMQALMAPGMIPGTQIQSTGNGVADSYLVGANRVAQAGANKLKPGSLEALSPLESGMFASALKRTGYDPNSFLAAYDASRPGQSAAGSY